MRYARGFLKFGTTHEIQSDVRHADVFNTVRSCPFVGRHRRVAPLPHALSPTFTPPGGGGSTDELIALLKGDVDESDGIPQSADISDADLDMIMCRDDLVGKAKPNPRVGPGWEEVEDRSGMSLLGNVNKE